MERYTFRHGGEDWETDYDELVPYRKPARSNWAGKRKRPCKKSKTGELCDFTVPKITHQYHTSWDGRWHYHRVMTCSRCGKYGPWSFFSTLTQL